MNTAWIMLVVAGLLEVGWAIGLKYTDGFNFRGRPLACTATLAAMVVSMYMLSMAVRTIPIGTGYAIWTGIGALGAAALGMILFREPATAARIICLLMIVFGIIGLKLSSPAAAQEPANTDPERSGAMIPFYIGGYSRNGNEGIYRAMLNPADGSMSAPTLAVPAKNPSFLIGHPKLPVLYSVSEIGKEKGKPAGNVRAFRINVDGSLIPLAEWLSQGEAPCYVSVDAAGRFLFAANYADGVSAAFPLDSDGKPGEASFVDRHTGSSVNPKRQEGPHAHCFVPDPSGRFAASCDLGTDSIVVYRINGTTIERDSVLKMPAGSGPRHLTFSADSKFAYVCTELSNQLATLSFDAASGRFELLDIQTTLPTDFKGETSTAEVAIHPSGRFVYVSNRGHDSISVFRIDQATGRATAAGYVPTGGHKPRHFAIDPSGAFLIAANEASNTLTSFAIDAPSGIPTATGSTAAVGAPSCVRFVR